MNRKLLQLQQMICLLILAVSCNKRSVSTSEFVAYVDNPSNNLIKEKTIGAVQLKCEFKPTEYVLIRDKYKDLGNMNFQLNENELGGIEKLNHFYLRLSTTDHVEILKKDIQTEQEYYQRLEYYTNIIQQDLFLVSGGDTIPCKYSLFERNYGSSPNSILLVGFDATNQKEDDDIFFIYDDHVLGIGPVQFEIDSKDLNKIPKLETTKI